MLDPTVDPDISFDPVSREEWVAAAEKALRGRSVDTIRSTLADGIVIEPLYEAVDASAVGQWPGQGDRRRANHADGLTAGWDVRQAHPSGPDPAATNAEILTDLARGVTSIELDLRSDPDDGALVLDELLADVLLDLAPVGLVTHGSGVAAARAYLEIVSGRGIPPAELRADLGCDPIGSLVLTGTAGVPVDDAMAEIVELAREVAATYPNVRTIRVDGTAYAGGGASPATELAAIVAAGVAWLRGLTNAGMDPTVAGTQIQFVVSLGTDQFGDIAKIRALRTMWARVSELSGVQGDAAAIQASMSEFVITAYDPWVNMLRATIACFAGAVGGADSIVIAPFDSAIGQPDDLGRRIARNTQLMLMEESNLHRVIDPGGGSWYVEALTDRLADAAWTQFREIESEGGIVGSLRSGSIQGRVAETWKATAADVATRRRPITGVSEFPELAAAPVLRPPRPHRSVSALGAEVRPIPRRRIAGDFEALRDAARSAATVPQVFLANLGPPSVHSPRSGWTANALAAGGVAVVDNEGFDDDDQLAAAFVASGCAVAVLCSSDDVYASRIPGAATALRGAGARSLYLAGNPGERRSADEAAGIDGFLHVGVDLVEALRSIQAILIVGPDTQTAGGAE